MGLYQRHLIPFLTHLSMKDPRLDTYRQRLVAGARGQVLEVGIGSGLNLRFYESQVEQVTGIDPASAMLARARRAVGQCRVPVSLREGVAAALPFPDASFDTVVLAWTLCTVPDAPAALAEVRRVLRPGGRVRFVEHGVAPEPGVRKWQERLNPLWRRVSGGCKMNVPIPDVLRSARLHLDQLESGYAEGPRMLSYFYEGEAHLEA